MPGNLRRKAGGRHSGVTEKDYLRARRRVINASSICAHCGHAIDKKLKPICRRVDTSGYTVENAHTIPIICGLECDPSHGRKANPFSASADHRIPVDKLPPGSPLLTDPRNMEATHLRCNISRGAGNGKPKYRTSKDWTV